MEIRIYDSELDLLGVIENQVSFIWTRRYNEAGDFEIHVPITERNRNLLRVGNIVYKTGFADAGVIEYIILEESNEKNEITVKGRFLVSYMDRRVIKGTHSYMGNAELIMRQLLSEDTEAIPRVVLGSLNGFTDEISFQCTYKNLLTYMSKIAKSFSWGFRFRPDFNSKQIIFEIYKGTDKSIAQGVNNRVIFSEMYDNLNSAIYTENSQGFKTKVYVGGQGEGSARTWVEVGVGEGLDLREDTVNASDISSEDLTQAQYEAALTQRGLEYLESNGFVSSFEYETQPDVNFTYRQDYDLGDIVTVKKDSWDIAVNMRITAVQEIYENGLMTVTPTLGNPLSETIDWEDK